MQQLKALYVDDVDITDECLKYLPELEELRMRSYRMQNKLTKLTGEGFKYLIKLRELFIGFRNIALPGLKYLPQLRLLHTENARITNDMLQNLQQLEHQCLSKSDVTDEGLKCLRQLKVLYALDTKITRNCLKHMPLLKELEVMHDRVSNEQEITSEILKHYPRIIKHISMFDK